MTPENRGFLLSLSKERAPEAVGASFATSLGHKFSEGTFQVDFYTGIVIKVSSSLTANQIANR